MTRRFAIRAFVMVAMAVLVPGLCCAATAFTFTGDGYSMASDSQMRVTIRGAFLLENGNIDYQTVQVFEPINPSGTIDMGMGLWETYTFNGAAANGKTYLYGWAIVDCRVNGGDWLPACATVEVKHKNVN